MSATTARAMKKAFKAEITKEIRRQAKNGLAIEHIERVVRGQFPSQLWMDWVKVANTEIERHKATSEAEQTF